MQTEQHAAAPLKKSAISTLNISLEVVDFPFHAEYELPELDGDCPLVVLTKAIVSLMSNHPDLRTAPLIAISRYPDIVFPCDSGDGTAAVEVMLCSRKEALSAWEVSDDVLGLFAVTCGPMGETLYSDVHRVVIPCDGDLLRQHLTKERNQERDPLSCRYDEEFLKAFLVTITHEIAHAVEFIRHTGGLSPRALDNLYDAREIELSVVEGCNGLGVLAEMDEFLGDPEGADNAMEERVEAKGYEWLGWVFSQIDRALIDAVLDAYGPA